jgi:Ulp1 family protease
LKGLDENWQKNYKITEDDYFRLDPKEEKFGNKAGYLSDGLIEFSFYDFYINLTEDQRKDIHFFDNTFYRKVLLDLTRLDFQSGIIAAKNNLINKKFLITPINIYGNHWILAIICFEK